MDVGKCRQVRAQPQQPMRSSHITSHHPVIIFCQRIIILQCFSDRHHHPVLMSPIGLNASPATFGFVHVQDI